MKKSEDIKAQVSIYEYKIVKQLGAFFKRERNATKPLITVRDLNAMTGVSIAVISDLENGKAMPRVETLLRLGEALNIEPNMIFEQMILNSMNIENQMRLGHKLSDKEKRNLIANCMHELEFSEEDIGLTVSYLEFLNYRHRHR